MDEHKILYITLDNSNIIYSIILNNLDIRPNGITINLNDISLLNNLIEDLRNYRLDILKEMKTKQ